MRAQTVFVLALISTNVSSASPTFSVPTLSAQSSAQEDDLKRGKSAARVSWLLGILICSQTFTALDLAGMTWKRFSVMYVSVNRAPCVPTPVLTAAML